MNVIFLGPPGAGKGTIAAKIKDQYSLLHLSTGDMLRSEIAEGTELGKLAKQFMDEGKLVSDDIIIGMVANKLKSTNGGILFDGFPRTVEQARALSEIAEIDAVIELKTTEDVVVGRICSRRMCRSCGAVHNTKWLEGRETCPDCDGELYIRDDDNEETVKKRFRVYEEQTAPLIDYYKDKGVLTTFDANEDIDVLAGKIGQVLEK
ncbi:MAG: adenylate kinase [Clostridiales bacterium]|nr:MAG: adenylate kinase [Clostridiales bacterium]